MTTCYLNGEYMPLDQAQIPATDIALLRGAGSFEYLRTYNRKPFLLEAHLERFQNSCKTIGFDLPFSNEELTKIVNEIIQKNPQFDEMGMKFIASGGMTVRGIEFEAAPATLFIFPEQFVPLPDSLYTEGATLITHDHLRTAPLAKTTNYLQSVMLQPTRKKSDAIEILYTHEGKVLECSTANIFFVKDQEIHTPKTDILIGTTRTFVFEIAKSLGMKIIEREMDVSELYNFSEAFITSTNREIVPVVKINGQNIADGKVGSAAQKLLAEFRAQVG